MKRSIVGLVLSASLSAQMQWTVPAAHTTQDADVALCLAGVGGTLRQQIVIGQSHLLPLVGHSLTALVFRREVADEPYLPGSCDIAVTLAQGTVTPQNTHQAYAANLGATPVTVHTGPVTFPASPGRQTTPAWSATDTVRIPFSTPFSYTGGSLVVDLIGIESPQGSGWWLVDATSEDITGATQSLGTACSEFSDSQADTAFVNPRDLVPGGTISYLGQGRAFNLAILVLGAPAGAPIPLTMLGLPATQDCTCQIHPSGVLATMISMFLPSPSPLVPQSFGIAQADLHLPAQSWMLSMNLASQWIELPTFKASNGVLGTVANQMPQLDMAIVVGSPNEPKGRLNLQVAPVVRFEYQ
jgi:hypothetical protein